MSRFGSLSPAYKQIAFQKVVNRSSTTLHVLVKFAPPDHGNSEWIVENAAAFTWNIATNKTKHLPAKSR
jgi:hypothetical protein